MLCMHHASLSCVGQAVCRRNILPRVADIIAALWRYSTRRSGTGPIWRSRSQRILLCTGCVGPISATVSSWRATVAGLYATGVYAWATVSSSHRLVHYLLSMSLWFADPQFESPAQVVIGFMKKGVYGGRQCMEADNVWRQTVYGGRQCIEADPPCYKVHLGCYTQARL